MNHYQITKDNKLTIEIKVQFPNERVCKNAKLLKKLKWKHLILALVIIKQNKDIRVSRILEIKWEN